MAPHEQTFPFSDHGEVLWSAGSFSLGAVLGGYAPCPPGVGCLVFVAWRPPDPPPVPAPPEFPAPPVRDALARARRASDHMVERPEAAQEEATMRAAWESGLSMLDPVAGRRLGACDLGFATAADTTGQCQTLLAALRRDHPAGEWRIGIAHLEVVGIMEAARALELWVLDAGDGGSWLVDVTDLVADPC